MAVNQAIADFLVLEVVIQASADTQASKVLLGSLVIAVQQDHQALADTQARVAVGSQVIQVNRARLDSQVIAPHPVLADIAA